MRQKNKFTLTGYIERRLREIGKSGLPDIKDLLIATSSGDLRAKEQLMEILMPLAKDYGISIAYRLVNYSNMNPSYVHDNEDDIVGESMLALAETVDIFAKSHNKNPDSLIAQIKKAVRTHVRAFIFSSGNDEISFSSFTADPDDEGSFIDNFSSQDDNEVEYELVTQLIKEDIVKILREYPEQDDVQLLYAYCGLHSMTFTELIESRGLTRKEASDRIKKVVDWFREASNIL